MSKRLFTFCRVSLTLLSSAVALTAVGHGIFYSFGLVNIFMLIVSLPVLAAAVRWEKAAALFHRFRRAGGIRRLLAFASALWFVCIFVFFGVFSAVMLYCAELDRPSPGAGAVIVLGCKIDGDRPSLMLSRRLNAAKKYLDSNPDTVAVLSGGFGEGLSLSETSVMRDYLVSKGVSPERLILEERSTSTDENLRFSAGLLRDMGIGGEVVIATDGFHQLRAHLWAGRCGLSPTSSVSSATPLHLFPYYYFREFMGVTRYLLLGY